MAGAVRRAAAAGGVERGLGVGNAGDHAAVVQQRQQHAEQGRFLSAMHARGRGEHRRGLADQGAAGPFAAEGVDEMLQWRGHVAEPGRAAEQQPGAFGEVALVDIGCARVGFRGRGDLGHRRHWRHRAQARLHAIDLTDPARNLSRQARHRAATAVVQDQDVRHAAPCRGVKSEFRMKPSHRRGTDGSALCMQRGAMPRIRCIG